jgi:hypothetical protein
MGVGAGLDGGKMVGKIFRIFAQAFPVPAHYIHRPAGSSSENRFPGGTASMLAEANPACPGAALPFPTSLKTRHELLVFRL